MRIWFLKIIIHFFCFLFRSIGDKFCSIATKFSPALSILASFKAFVAKISESYFSIKTEKMNNQHSILRKGQVGMTLIEIMVAMSIMAVIMMLIWSSTSQNLNAKIRIEARDMVYHNSRVVYHKILDDLAMAFLTTPPKGVPGEKKQILTFFVGEDRSGQDELKFTSFSHMKMFAKTKDSDQCKIYYRLAPAEEEDEKGMRLIRTEVPWLDYSYDVEGKNLVLAKGVKEFKLEYYDMRKTEWVNEWDTEKIDWKGRLPRAVRVSITFHDPSGEEDSEIKFQSAVLLPLYSSPIEIN